VIQSEILTALKTTTYPVAYHHFKEAPALPYITFIRTNDSNISSDEKVHGKIKNYQIELYTIKKDLTAEGKVEAVLGEIDSEFDTNEAYIESEELFQVVPIGS